MFHTVSIRLRGFVRSEHNIESSLNDSCEGYFSFNWIKECGPLVPIHTIQESRISWLRTNMFHCIFVPQKELKKKKSQTKRQQQKHQTSTVIKTVSGDNAEESPKLKNDSSIEKLRIENSEKIYEFSWNSMDSSINDSILLLLFYLVILKMIRCVVCRLFYGHFHFIHSHSDSIKYWSALYQKRCHLHY